VQDGTDSCYDDEVEVMQGDESTHEIVAQVS